MFDFRECTEERLMALEAHFYQPNESLPIVHGMLFAKNQPIEYHVDRFSPAVLHATMTDRYPLTVRLDLREEDGTQLYHCNCRQDQSICKHVYAVFFTFAADHSPVPMEERYLRITQSATHFRRFHAPSANSNVHLEQLSIANLTDRKRMNLQPDQVDAWMAWFDALDKPLRMKTVQLKFGEYVERMIWAIDQQTSDWQANDRAAIKLEFARYVSISFEERWLKRLNDYYAYQFFPLQLSEYIDFVTKTFDTYGDRLLVEDDYGTQLNNRLMEQLAQDRTMKQLWWHVAQQVWARLHRSEAAKEAFIVVLEQLASHLETIDRSFRTASLLLRQEQAVLYFGLQHDSQVFAHFRKYPRIIDHHLAFDLLTKIEHAGNPQRLWQWLKWFGLNRADVFLPKDLETLAQWLQTLPAGTASAEEMEQWGICLESLGIPVYTKWLWVNGHLQQWADYQMQTLREPVRLTKRDRKLLYKQEPLTALAFAHDQIDRWIARRDLDAYRKATDYLKWLKEVYTSRGQAYEWELTKTYVRKNYARMRKLMALVARGGLLDD